jgi:hypothetical protein
VGARRFATPGAAHVRNALRVVDAIDRHAVGLVVSTLEGRHRRIGHCGRREPLKPGRRGGDGPDDVTFGTSYRYSMRIASSNDKGGRPMSRASANALAVARPAIQILVVVNLVYALVLAGLLATSFFIAGWPERPLGFDLTGAYPWVPLGLRAIVVVGLAGAAIFHAILRRLLAIVDTVRGGDPFILDNARRLDQIAWCALALNVLQLIVAWIAAVVWEPGKVDPFSVSSWLAVLMLFVLAGVFAHGARLRADLDGTV